MAKARPYVASPGRTFFALAFALLSAFCVNLTAAAATAPPAKAKPQWVLSYEGKSTNQFIWDRRTRGLVQQVIPAKLSKNVLDGLGGPPDPVFVEAGRYVSASACIPHDCPEKAFFWIDTATGNALGAYYLSGPWQSDAPNGYDSGPGELTLGSNTLSPAQIPPQARQALVEWMTEHDMRPASVSFVGRGGASTVLATEDFQPRPEFRPSATGPAFDCKSASSQIETTICASAELSKLDLEVANLSKKIRQGSGTAGAQHQLIELQREWRQKRDSDCSAAASMADCLRSSYKQQYDRLENWIPK